MSFIRIGFGVGAIAGVGFGLFSVQNYNTSAPPSEWSEQVSHHLLQLLWVLGNTAFHAGMFSAIGAGIAKCLQVLGTQDGPTLEELQRVVINSNPRPGM